MSIVMICRQMVGMINIVLGNNCLNRESVSRAICALDARRVGF